MNTDRPTLKFSKEAEQVNCPFGSIVGFEDYCRKLRDWCRSVNMLIAEVDGEAHATRLLDWWSSYYDNGLAHAAASKLNAAIYGLDGILSRCCDDIKEGIAGAYTTEWAFWMRVIHEALEMLNKSEIGDEVGQHSSTLSRLPFPSGMDWDLTQKTMLFNEYSPRFVNGYFGDELSMTEALAVARLWTGPYADPVDPEYLIIVMKRDVVAGILAVDDAGMVVRIDSEFPKMQVRRVTVADCDWNLLKIYERMEKAESEYLDGVGKTMMAELQDAADKQ